MEQEYFLGKTALITGGSGDIGRGIAMRLAEAGSDIVLTCHTSTDKGEIIKQEIESTGRQCLLIQVDLSDYHDVERMIGQAMTKFSCIDILVNNAGTSGFMGPVTDTSPEEWDRLLKVNLYSVFYVSRLVIPGMKNKGYGRIINISSIGYRRVISNMASYLVSKAGINTLTQALSRETGHFGITVNAIAPGQVCTERVMKVRLPGLSEQSGVSVEKIQAEILKESHTGKFTTVDDIAELVLFLSSDKAGNITGEIIDLAGGF